MGEHLPCKQGVMGSNPIISTTRQCREPNSAFAQYRSGVRSTTVKLSAKRFTASSEAKAKTDTRFG